MIGRTIGERVAHLVAHVVLVYGSSKVWDEAHGRMVQISHLRLAYGDEAVDEWRDHPCRRTLMPSELAALQRALPPGCDKSGEKGGDSRPAASGSRIGVTFARAGAFK